MSSPKSPLNISKAGSSRKRRQPDSSQSVQSGFEKRASGFAIYNLRSRDVAKKSKADAYHDVQSSDILVLDDHNRNVATVTPAIGVRRRPQKHSQIHPKLFAASRPVPDGVIDIFARRPCIQGKQLICPMHWRYSMWTLDSSLDLSLFHVNHYGLEYATLLFEQETREQEDLVSITPNQNLSVQNILSTFSWMVDGNVHSDYSSQSESETVSDPRTPLPGTKLKYRLNESLTPISLRFSAVSDSEPLACQPNITPKMRGILVNWLVEVSMEYKVSVEAFHLSISILDTLLARGATRNENAIGYENDDDSDNTDNDSMREGGFVIRRADFQAVGCACLWIASKVQDKCFPTADDFVYISDYSFTSDKLRIFEARICKQLEFRLLRVTPFNFLNIFLKASYACNSGRHCQYDNAVLRLLTTYLLELSRLSCDLIVKKPSLIAAAALHLARVTMGLRETNATHCAESDYWTKTLVHYTGYSTADLEETALLIYQHHLSAETAETKASFLKYKKSCHLGVSLKTVPPLESLELPSTLAHFNWKSSLR